MSLKEQYVKYSLIAIIIVLGVVIFRECRPFLGGILGACTIYVLLRNQMIHLTEVKRIRKSVVAILLLLETILCILIPLSLVGWFVFNQVQYMNLNVNNLLVPIQDIADFVQKKIGYNILQYENFSSVAAVIPKVGQAIMGNISSFAVNVFILLFVLYFMLLGGRNMEKYVYEVLPFHQTDKKNLMHEIFMIVRSNAIAIPLLAIIQGGFAVCGYYLFDVPNPLVMGFLTSFATIIPIVGTALIWVPLVAYMLIIGDWQNGIFLLLYAVIVITNVDNVARFVLQKKIADIHPLVTIFGVFIGISLFGFIGVIFGPLMLSIFILCANLFKEAYL